jgi:heme oxygenase
MHVDESVRLFAKIFNQIGKHWKAFINSLKRKANPNDESQILFSDFIVTLRKYGAKLTLKEQDSLLQALPGQ